MKIIYHVTKLLIAPHILNFPPNLKSERKINISNISFICCEFYFGIVWEKYGSSNKVVF